MKWTISKKLLNLLKDNNNNKGNSETINWRMILGASLLGKILQGKAVKTKTTGQGEIRGS